MLGYQELDQSNVEAAYKRRTTDPIRSFYGCKGFPLTLVLFCAYFEVEGGDGANTVWVEALSI